MWCKYIHTIQGLADKVVKILEESGDECSVVSVSTGNTRVFCEKISEFEGGGCLIAVSENYKEIHLGNSLIGGVEEDLIAECEEAYS